MVAIPSEVSVSLESPLSPGELSPMNDQSLLHPEAPAATVADFDLEVEELAFYRQDEERVWCSLGTNWDM